MKRASAIGWGSAALAFAAILIVLVDIIHTQSNKSIDTGAPVVKTDQAAGSAGAAVTPTDPKQVR